MLHNFIHTTDGKGVKTIERAIGLDTDGFITAARLQ